MPLAQAYLITTKNLDALLNSIQAGQAPERFSNTFLLQLGFTSSNDRLYIRLLKELDFIDDAGVPQKRYFQFLDQTQAKRIMADAIREAYHELFVLNKQAWKWSVEEVYNKLKTLTEGKKSEKVLSLMANTFKALCDWADWSPSIEAAIPPLAAPAAEIKGPSVVDKKIADTSEPVIPASRHTVGKPQLHYNLQVILPATRDSSVYDAIFQSMKKHLID